MTDLITTVSLLCSLQIWPTIRLGNLFDELLDRLRIYSIWQMTAEIIEWKWTLSESQMLFREMVTDSHRRAPRTLTYWQSNDFPRQNRSLLKYYFSIPAAFAKISCFFAYIFIAPMLFAENKKNILFIMDNSRNKRWMPFDRLNKRILGYSCVLIHQVN